MEAEIWVPVKKVQEFEDLHGLTVSMHRPYVETEEWKLQIPDFKWVTPPNKSLYFMQHLPFSPEDVDYLPEKSKEITEDDIELTMLILKDSGSPNRDNPERLRQEAIETLKRKNITKKQAEIMMEQLEQEWQKIWSDFLQNHVKIMFKGITPEGETLVSHKYWVSKEEYERIRGIVNFKR